MHNSFRNDTTYKIIKLSNGETIIASLINEGKKSIFEFLINLFNFITEFTVHSIDIARLLYKKAGRGR